MREPPYPTVLKPYGEALLALARQQPNVVCLSADLTRQTETDLFRDALPERFINVGMAEANMIGIAGGLARAGHVVFVNTFGVFCTRRCFDQIAMAIAYPSLNVKLIGFMPGLSSPGGPSHQAIEDVALMRALPNMMVIEPADATETRQVVNAVARHSGPVYVRLKRGEMPLIFDPDHRFELGRAQQLLVADSAEVCIVAAGMMVPAALAAARVLEQHDVRSSVVNLPVIKPLDRDTVLETIAGTRVVVTAENHTVVGGLGSSIAELMAEQPSGARLVRVGLKDTFAEAGSRDYLFSRYGLDTQSIVRAAWAGLGRGLPAPAAPARVSSPGAYAPV